MKARIDAGTDVAMVGAWDAQRNATPFTATELGRHVEMLEADAAEGHLFLLRTGADGGGPVDVYVDEALPKEVRDRLAPAGRECLLLIPSGALVVAGAEDYRSAKPRTTGSSSALAVPPGSYSLRCYTPKYEERSPRSDEELKELVGSADLAYFDRTNNVGCLIGALIPLLFPVLSFPLGWKVALVITFVAFFAFFPLRERLLRRSARYRRLSKVVPAFRLQNQEPTFVLVLHPIRDGTRLTGGSVSL